MTQLQSGPVERHQKHLAKRRANFIEQLAVEPPQPCKLHIGQSVTFTNEYGVHFPGCTIIGFAQSDTFYGRFVHLDTDCYWMPKHPASITPD